MHRVVAQTIITMMMAVVTPEYRVVAQSIMTIWIPTKWLLAERRGMGLGLIGSRVLHDCELC